MTNPTLEQYIEGVDKEFDENFRYENWGCNKLQRKIIRRGVETWIPATNKQVKSFLKSSIQGAWEKAEKHLKGLIFEHDLGTDDICKNCGKFVTYQGYCIQHKYRELEEKLSQLRRGE